uniref:Calponin likey domain-containing protein n=1 Tax=Talaromyces marneffei PM1 TaxID=1077442 RepID=A0A093VHN0_TALMA
MEPFLLTDTELQVGTERSRKYLGTAKIDLDHISFHPDSSRTVDPQNIDRLREVFRSEGCRRYEIQNHITGVVSRESLQAALRAAHKSPDELLTTTPQSVPRLQFSAGQVLCLHGQHRIRAGAEVLLEEDRWWTVDLYLDDISAELRTALIEEYANERRPNDGEIYRKIRQYQQEHNAHFQRRWLVRLSSSKTRRLQQLHRNIEIQCAFDALLPITGVWDGMSIGKLSKVMALDSDEVIETLQEVLNYLSHIEKFWVELVSVDAAHPNLAAMTKIDSHTVKKLESMAPGVSRADAKTVHGWVISGEVLGGFSETERRHMWERMQQFDGLIPSLHTFFRDMDYLEACADAVKRLFPLSKAHPTLWSAMSHSYTRPTEAGDQCLIQTSESHMDRRPSDNVNRLELAYRQVWLYAMRHYPSMSKDPESDDLLTRPASEKADETVVYAMAVLAQKLGFTSAGVKEIIDQSPDRQIAVDCLLKARKPESYQYSAADLERSVRRIVECFAAATPREQPLRPHPVVTFAANRRARGGLPSRQAQKNDRRFLFIDHLHRNASTTEKVSTWFVRRSVYFAFFGRCFSPPPDAPAERTTEVANSTSPRSPLFVPDDASVGTSDTGIGDPLLVTEMEEDSSGGVPGTANPRHISRDLVAVAAERGRLQQQELEYRAAVAEERLRKEAEDRAAAEAAEQERLRREAERLAAEAEQERLLREAQERAAAVAAEQERLRKQAEDRAAAEAAEQARLRHEEEKVAFAAEQERLRREAERVAAEAAEQERLQREANAAEQVRLQKEAEERAAIEAAEQERLRREQAERVLAEQERLEMEAQERAAVEAAERERLQQIQREAEEQAAERAAAELAEQEQLRREANSAEEQRIAQARALALAHLEQGDKHASALTDTVPLERSSATTQIDITPDLPSLITQLREASDSPDEDHNAIVEPHGIATQNIFEDGRQPALDSHALEAPTNDVSPPWTITAGLEPITEEAEVSNPIPPVIIDDDRQRQLREQIAERRRADKEKVANAERAPLEIDDHFTQTRSAEDEDLYEPYEEAVTTEPTMSPEGASVALETDRIPTAIPPASAPTASFDPSLPRNTQLEFRTIMAHSSAWPGTLETSPGDIGPDSSATAEETASPASGLSLLGRTRKTSTKEAKSRRNEAPDPRRQLPPLPDDLGADSMIFWVWKANKWREMERVTLDPSDPLRAERVALRYERDEPVEFVDRSMHAVAAAKCVQVAQAEGSRSIFLLLRDGPLERPITRAMAMAADDIAKETTVGEGRKRPR